MSTLKEVKEQAWRELREKDAELRQLRALQNAVEAAEEDYELLLAEHASALERAEFFVIDPACEAEFQAALERTRQLGDELEAARDIIDAAREATQPAALAAAEEGVEAARVEAAKASRAWAHAQAGPSQEELREEREERLEELREEREERLERLEEKLQAFWANIWVVGGQHALTILALAFGFAGFFLGESEALTVMASAPFVASLDDKMSGYSDFVGAPERLVAELRGARLLQNLSDQDPNTSRQERRVIALRNLRNGPLKEMQAKEWSDLQTSDGFRVGMSKEAAQFAVLADLIEERFEAVVGQPLAARLGTFLAKVLLYPEDICRDDLALLGWEAHDGLSTYEYLHSLGREEALRAALTEVYSSTLSSKLVDYGLGNTEELTITREDITQAHVYDMTRTRVMGLKASEWLVADDNPEPVSWSGTAHVVLDDDGNPKEDYVRERALPGVVRVVWEGETEVREYGQRLVARAPYEIMLTDGRKATLLASQPKQNWYLAEDAPDWVAELLEPAQASRSPKQKSDLFTLLKRPGTSIVSKPGDESVVETIKDVRPFEDEADFDGLNFSVSDPDLGVWVMPDEQYTSVANGVEDSPVGGLQVTAVFEGNDKPWYFKGLIVPESLSAMPTGMYDGFKGLHPEAEYGSGRCVRLSVMRSLGAEPWGSSVNSQALTYVGLQDGDEIAGVTEPGVQFPAEHVAKFVLGVNGLGGFTRELRDWCNAQVAEFGRKRSTDGVAGVALPVNRPNVDAEFVLLTDGKQGYENGEVLEAVFLWNPALPTHQDLMKVRVRVEHRKELSGSRILAVNVANDDFLTEAYIDHAGRDIDGDGFVLSFESHLVDNAVRWQDVTLTDSTMWKATTDEEANDQYAAIQASYERQFNSSKLGKYELQARRAIQLGVNMDATFTVATEDVDALKDAELKLTIREAYAGLIQMAISMQKKLVSDVLWDRVVDGLEEALKEQQVFVDGAAFQADLAIKWAGGMSPRAWEAEKKYGDPEQAKLFYRLHGQDDELDDFTVDGRSYKFLPTTLVDLTKLYGKVLREQSAAERQFGKTMQRWTNAEYREWYPGTTDGLLQTTPLAVNVAAELVAVGKTIPAECKLREVIAEAPGGERVLEAVEGMFRTLKAGDMGDTMSDQLKKITLPEMDDKPAYELLAQRPHEVPSKDNKAEYLNVCRTLLDVFNYFSADSFRVNPNGKVPPAVGRSFNGAEPKPYGTFGTLYDNAQGGRDERLEEIGSALKERYYARMGATTLPEELLEAFDEIMSFWSHSGGQADYRQRVQYVLTQLNKLVAEYGEDVVYGVALAGAAKEAPGKLSVTLIGHLDPATLARLAMATDVELFSDKGFPVVVRDISRFERGKSYTYGAMMARLAEGATASVLPQQNGVVYRVYGLGDLTVKTATVKDRSFTSGGLIWVNAESEDKVDPEDLIEVPEGQ